MFRNLLSCARESVDEERESVDKEPDASSLLKGKPAPGATPYFFAADCSAGASGRRNAWGAEGGSFDTVQILSPRRYILNISDWSRGREPRRPKTPSWLPDSSTARSRSRPLEIASAGALVA